MEELIRSLQSTGILKDEKALEAFQAIDRRYFVTEQFKDYAYRDEALPIGEQQSISQPYTVAFMISLLLPQPGNNIMDIGYGSGWLSALLAHMVGKAGHVHALEIVDRLCKFGQANINNNYPDLAKRVSFYCQDGYNGLPLVASSAGGFDGIIVSAEVNEVPIEWRRQLKIGGRLVYPRFGSIFQEIKKDEFYFVVEEYPGFAFVPFLRKKDSQNMN